jgi:subtilisin family serine protease
MNAKRMTRWYTYLALLVIMGLLLSSGGAALAARPAGAGERVDVFIGFHSEPGPAEQALVRGVGGDIRYSYWLVPAIAASIPEAAVSALQRNPNVTVIEPVIEVYAVDYAVELDNTWGVKRIQVGAVHPDYMGTNVKVAVIDSGIDYMHSDLETNYAGGWNYVDGNDDPMDDNGHGTHVAGTVAALRNSVGVVGAAPEAALYALKVLGADGGGSYDDVIAALQWAVENDIQVTNNSYGSSGDPGTLVKNAFDNAYTAGILNVCAAGNSGNPAGRGDNIIYPARYDSCIAVAASDSKDKRASFSSTGPDVELIAPGVSINSTVPGGGYAAWSGTSMASPHVAGVAALAWAANPSLTNQELRAILQETAEELGLSANHQGYGLVRADLAVAAVGEVSPPEPEDPVTDIAITEINAPSPVVQGDNVIVSVTVANVGNQDVTDDITVSLTYDYDSTSVVIGTQTINDGLVAGDSVTLSFSWETNDVETGEYTLTASHDFEDDDSANNSESITVSVNGPSDAETMHVADLDGWSELKGRSGRWEAFVTVTIQDADGNPVSDATVHGAWSEATTGNVLGATGSGGTVTFSTGNMSSGASVTFEVTDVTHGTLQYDPLGNTETSITITK